MENSLSILLQKNSASLPSGTGLCLQTPLATAQGLTDVQTTKTVVEQGQSQASPLEQRAKVNYDSYILGPGDALQIELFDLPELSGRFSIGPDGTLYLPRLRALYVEGLTVEELRTFLTLQFSTYVRDPSLMRVQAIRVYVGGEVKRQGYYTLRGETNLSLLSQTADNQQLQAGNPIEVTRPGLGAVPGGASAGPGGSGQRTFGAMFPTVFDAIRSAQGVTPYTNLSQVQVIRKRADGLGGGRIKTTLNFLSLITEGNESQNIRLFDGDSLTIGKSPIVLRDQLLKAGQSNLSPQFMEVFVTGRVHLLGLPSAGEL